MICRTVGCRCHQCRRGCTCGAGRRRGRADAGVTDAALVAGEVPREVAGAAGGWLGGRLRVDGFVFLPSRLTLQRTVGTRAPPDIFGRVATTGAAASSRCRRCSTCAIRRCGGGGGPIRAGSSGATLAAQRQRPAPGVDQAAELGWAAAQITGTDEVARPAPPVT